MNKGVNCRAVTIDNNQSESENSLLHTWVADRGIPNGVLSPPCCESVERIFKSNSNEKQSLEPSIRETDKDAINSHDFVDEGEELSEKSADTDVKSKLNELDDDDSGVISDDKEVKEEPNEDARHVAHGEMTDQDNTLTCDICSETFCSKSMLDIHSISHADDKKYKCSLCPSMFRKRYILTQHMRTHSEIREFECSVCKSTFKRKGDLAQHSKIHTGERPWSCDYCDKRFMRSSHLYQHQRTHTGERQAFYQLHKPHKCRFCERTFHRKSDMEEHVMTHTGERPYICPTCGKAFRRRFHLNQHLPVHTKERKFVCKDCDNTFIRQSDLHQHLQKHADSEKMFVCVCGVVYQTWDEYKRHEIKHSANMINHDRTKDDTGSTLICVECGETFINQMSLNSHKQSEHAIVVIKGDLP